MATQFEIVLPWGTPQAEAAATDALDLIDRLEAQLTVYRSTSEVSRLNALAAQAPVPLEPHLFELLQTADRISRETAGAFDITAGPLIKAWGFHARQGRVPDDGDLGAARDLVGMNHLQFNSDRRSLQFDRHGVEINLGSIGKGYALDRAAEKLQDRWQIRAALLDGGTSSVLALGTPPGDTAGWSIGIKHPWAPRRLARVRLRHRALAISAATFQHFDYNNRKLGHLLDPRTGRPADGTALAAAIANTGAEADALATAFYVLGIEGTQQYCAEHPEVSALLLPEDGELTAFNLTATDWYRDESLILESE